MSRSVEIDGYGQVRPVRQRPRSLIIDRSGDRPGTLLIRHERNGLHVVLHGSSISRALFYKMVHTMASHRPQRIILTQCTADHALTTIFRGVWEFAGYAETLVSAATP